MKILELVKRLFVKENTHDTSNVEEEFKTQEKEPQEISSQDDITQEKTECSKTKEYVSGREYYRGLVVGYCHRCYQMSHACLFVTNDRKLDPQETFEEYKEYIESDIVRQSLQFCVDRFNRKSDNGISDDFDKGMRLANWIDPTYHTSEEQALYLLNIYDDMCIESLSATEAYECALICNMAEKNEMAMTLLEYAAENGDCFAMHQMGNFAASADEMEKAKAWYLKSAEKGFAASQYSMGNIYYYGQGVDVDYTEAMKWFALAAEQGQPKAQCNLGACYYYGQGTDVDYEQAFKWYYKSAEQEEPNALYNLGTCYMEGQGTEADTTKAIECFSKAAKLGHPGAEARISLYSAMLKGSNNSD